MGLFQRFAGGDFKDFDRFSIENKMRDQLMKLCKWDGIENKHSIAKRNQSVNSKHTYKIYFKPLTSHL